MDIGDTIATAAISAIFGFGSGYLASQVNRRADRADRRRDDLLRALTDTEQLHLASLQGAYYEAIKDEESARRLQAYLDTRPYPMGNLMYLGPDADAYVKGITDLIVMPLDDPTAILIHKMRLETLVKHRMAEQRALVEAGKPALERPKV